jgi:hypothetical protein
MMQVSLYGLWRSRVGGADDDYRVSGFSQGLKTSGSEGVLRAELVLKGSSGIYRLGLEEDSREFLGAGL